MENRILEFPVSSATVELAAQALGCNPERIAKTLSFKVENKAVLIVAAGDAKVDNAKYKAFFHTKAKMLTPEELEVLTSLKTFNAAKIVAASLPIVVFYPFMQRFFVSGLTLGSVKE